jgi:hypothetical protein
VLPYKLKVESAIKNEYGNINKDHKKTAKLGVFKEQSKTA